MTKTLEDLSREELLSLIKHEVGSTLTLGHPVQCAMCGDYMERTLTLHGKPRQVYIYGCDICEERDYVKLSEFLTPEQRKRMIKGDSDE